MSQSTTLRVLSLQPWYGGSHKQFVDAWKSASRHDWTLIGLPAANWKWRMRIAAIEFSRRVAELAESGKTWDVVLCTDLLNVAELRALTPAIQQCPIVVYFHENQFAYPNPGKQQPDHQFLITNFVSALAADHIWFNSLFNRATFFKGIRQQSNLWPEFEVTTHIERIQSRSKIAPPSIQWPESQIKERIQLRKARVDSGEPLHLIWAARWEYDKNPEALLKTLELLNQQKVPFRVSVIGETTESIPDAFRVLKRKFEFQIEHWGYQKSRNAYWSALESADIFLSTADHEFFGLSVAESISIGVWPLLPNRLAYPELLAIDEHRIREELFTYQGTAKQLAKQIRERHFNRDWNWDALESLAKQIRVRLEISKCAEDMDRSLGQVARDHRADR